MAKRSKILKRGRGRPSLGPRANLGLRVSLDLKRRIDRAASQAGVTQSKFAEHKLEESFRAEDRVWTSLELAFGPRLAGVLLVAGKLAELAGIQALHNPGGPVFDPWRDWISQHDACQNVHHAVSRFLELAIPPSDGPGRDETEFELDHKFTEETIARLLSVINGGSDTNPELPRWGKQVRELLGEELTKRLADNFSSSKESR